MTIDWADELTDQIDRYRKKEKNSLYRDKLLSLLGNIMYEKGYAAGSLFYPEKNMRMIFPLVRKQIVIARLRETAIIRNELEILNTLQSKDHFYMKKQAKEGLMLSSDYEIHRYKKYFSNFLQNFH